MTFSPSFLQNQMRIVKKRICYERIPAHIGYV